VRRKFSNPRLKPGSSTDVLGMYVNGTLKRRRTFPVANRPHCVSLRRNTLSSGSSSRGPQSRTGFPTALQTFATVSSVPKLQCSTKTASTWRARNFSEMRSAIFVESNKSPSGLISSRSTISRISEYPFRMLRISFLNFCASSALKVNLLYCFCNFMI
jgi:hypothetical protein